MDLTKLQDALAAKSYHLVASICDDLLLQVAATLPADEFQENWPYAIHLLAHLYSHDLNSARFLWKTIPQWIKDSRPEIGALWKIGQALWNRDHAGVYAAVDGFAWGSEISDFVEAFVGNYKMRMFQLLMSAYSTICVADVARFLGMSEDAATNYALQHGWSLDSTSMMLSVMKPKIVSEQKIDPSKMQRLTELVFHLEH